MRPFGGIAFDNPRNRCYANSICNALLSSNIIVSNINPGHCLSCKFLSGIYEQDQELHSSQKMIEIVSSLAPYFSEENQNDPSEFMQIIIQNCGIINELTAHKIYTSFECSACKFITHVEEKRNIFYKDISSDNFSDMMKNPKTILKKFCSLCLKDMLHEAKEYVKETPKVCVVVLKRFKTTQSGRQIGKIDNNVEPPMEHCIGDSDVFYRNKAIVEHHGKFVHKGHVICYLNHHDHWIICNDSKLQRTSIMPRKGFIFISDNVNDKIFVSHLNADSQPMEESATESDLRIKRSHPSTSSESEDLNSEFNLQQSRGTGSPTTLSVTKIKIECRGCKKNVCQS